MSLEFYRKAHEARASSIEGWKTMNKNDLVNKYIEVEDNAELADAYMSAILCRYWGVIASFRKNSFRSIHDETIYYDWLTYAVMRAIDKRRWKDPQNKLYNDSNGPDKVINRCLKCARLGWYQQANRPGKKANHATESIEQAADNGFLNEDKESSEKISSVAVKDLVERFMKRGEYVSAFAVSGIVTRDVFDTTVEDGKKYLSFNKKRLVKYLYNLSEDDCEDFSEYFNIPLDEATHAKDDIAMLSRARLHTAVRRSLTNIKRAYLED